MIRILCALLLITSCSKVELKDQEQLKFAALATQGDFPDKVNITWSLNPYYKYYQVFRASGQFTGDHKAVSDKITKAQCVDKDTIPGKNYYYHVVSYNHEDVPIYQTESVLGYAGIAVISPPKNIQTKKAISSEEIRLNWSAVPEADGYAIYRSLSSENVYTSIAQTLYPYFSDTIAIPGVLYKYRISSVDSTGFEGGLSNPVEGLRFGINNNISATDGEFTDKIIVSWDPVLCAQSYNIYRSIDQDAPQFLTHTRSLTYTDKDSSLKDSLLYYYWIEAISKISDLAISDKSRRETGFKRSSSAPSDTPVITPAQLVTIQGKEKNQISLSWESVLGATSYEVYRAEELKGSYTKIGSVSTTSFIDNNPPLTKYTYFYTVAALNGNDSGPHSQPVEAWTLKAPFNIDGSRYYSDKIILTWDSVPEAISYNVYNQAGNKIATVITNSFTEKIALGIQNSLSKSYKISTLNKEGLESDLSSPIIGIAQKTPTPANFKIINNKTDSEKFLSMSWDTTEGIKKYRIYRSIFMHRFENRVDVEKRFKLLTELESHTKFYRDSLTKFPLRRYLYKMVAVNEAGEESESTPIIEAYRYPNDINEFIRDVDYTIYFTQVQINNFGSMGLEQKVNGRGSGHYDYASKINAIRNNWRQLTQFEISVNGDTKMGIITSPLGSSMNGPLDVTGLYKGVIEYIGLQALDGGTVANGSIKAVYHHPTLGTLTTTRTVSQINSLMITIRMGNDPGYTQPNPDDYLP
ncbi:MAG: fibronectin type III domain-containing protein [Brevinema sp.]